MTIDLTPILQAVIALLAALVTYKLVPWIKSKTDAQQQANLMALVKVAVYAAEQVYGAGHGADKLAYARDWLAQRGYAVDLAAIEASVKKMNMEMVDIDTLVTVEESTDSTSE